MAWTTQDVEIILMLIADFWSHQKGLGKSQARDMLDLEEKCKQLKEKAQGPFEGGVERIGGTSG